MAIALVQSGASRVERARLMLAGQRQRLQAAISILAADRYEAGTLKTARKLLAKVRSFEADSDMMVTLALGFMGENGDAPLIRSVCAAADRLAMRGRVAA